MNERRIAVIAGDGLLPVYWLEKAAEHGFAAVVLAITECSDICELENKAESFFKISAGRLGKILDIVKSMDIKQAVLLGRVDKNDLFAGEGPDDRLIKMITRLNGWDAAGFFRALAVEYQSEGIHLLEQTLFMEDYLASEGNMTQSVEVCDSIMSDMKTGFRLAKSISDMGIGQTVVVKDGVAVAVEALEGTNGAVERSGSLVYGGVVAKVSSEKQDFRFDVPTVGIDTIRCMINAKSAALVIEAGRTLMLDKDAMLDLAARHGIAVFGRMRDA
jgi:UDP-2,3-diacylglucosamine hydrolase